MSWLRAIRPRVIVLLLVWVLPAVFYLVAGLVALYQTGWFYWMLWTLLPLWLVAWLVGRFWPPTRLHHSVSGAPLMAPQFWTPRDTVAISIVEDFRREVNDVDYQSVADFSRYLGDARELAERLAKHYHADNGRHLLHPLTLVEILAVIHLAVEDLEEWMLKNIPGSDLATVGQLGRLPGYIGALDVAQKVFYFATAILNPPKIFAYPLWRKSGRVAVEIQNELIRSFYQHYLRQLGFYLIEMYSGRLQGGSRRYRSRFGAMAAAVHASGGNATVLNELQDVNATIAVMGQVKAGKSSLINALMQDQVAATSVLPETRQVQRFQYSLPESDSVFTLLDTPGYSEADVKRDQRQQIRIAADAADIVLLVMAANSPARDADIRMVRALLESYQDKGELRPPALIAVLTHIDLLRPVREWSPPYDWRNPKSAKEKSIASAVEYTRELFGDSICGYACVYTGDTHPSGISVANELVPQLIEHLDHGQAVATLKAFYRQLSQQRLARLTQQVIKLLSKAT